MQHEVRALRDVHLTVTGQALWSGMAPYGRTTIFQESDEAVRTHHAGVFVGLFLFFIGLPLLLIVPAPGSSSKTPAPAQAVLELDLRGGLTDQAPTNPFAGFGGSSLSVMRDRRRPGPGRGGRPRQGAAGPPAGKRHDPGLGRRDCVRRSTASARTGKVVIAHSQGFMPSGAVVSTYMLGASATEFWMQETRQLPGHGAGLRGDLLRPRLRAATASAPISSSATNTRTPSIPTPRATSPRRTARRLTAGWGRSTTAPWPMRPRTGTWSRKPCARPSSPALTRPPAPRRWVWSTTPAAFSRPRPRRSRRAGDNGRDHPLFRLRLRRGRAKRVGPQRHRHRGRGGRHPDRAQLRRPVRRRVHR